MTRIERWPAPALAAAAGAIGLIVANRPFWFDEAYSVRIARLPAGTIAELTASTDVAYTSSYYHLLHLWTSVLGLGYSPHAVRALSAFLAVAAVPVTYGIARRLLDARTAVLAAALMAVSPFFGRYASEGRQYALVLLCATLVVYCYLRASEALRPTRWVLGLAAAGAIGATAHWLLALVVLAVDLTAAWAWRKGELPTRRLLQVAAGSMLAVVPMAALALRLRSNRATMFDNVAWIPEPSWHTFTATTTSILGAPGALSLPLLALIAVGLWRAPVLVRIWLLAPLVLTWVGSYAQPIFLDRYLIIVVPPVCIATALGVLAIAEERSRLRVLVVVMAVGVAGLVHVAVAPGELPPPPAEGQTWVVAQPATDGR